MYRRYLIFILRKMKLHNERERQYPSFPRHTCISELYAEISESPNSEPKVTY